MKTLFRLFLCSVAMAAATLSAGALEDSMKQDMDDVLAVLKANPEAPSLPAITEVLERRFSFYAISRRALGREWGRFSEAQQAEFVERFTALLVKTYVSRYNPQTAGGVKVTWGDVVDLGAKKKEVETAVIVNGESVKVLYRLADLEGDWKVYDVLIEGVSLVSNYREQFASILGKGGPEDVLAALEKKS